MLGVERHLLDEPQLVAAVEAPAEQLGRLVVVDAAQQHRVDLHRAEPGRLGRREPGDDVVEAVAAGDLEEGVGPDGVEADVDPVEAGLGERSGGARQAEPLVVMDSSTRGRSPRAADDVDQATAHQRLAAGEPDLADAEPLDRDVISRTTSSSVSTSSAGSQSRPSAGMQ